MIPENSRNQDIIFVVHSVYHLLYSLSIALSKRQLNKGIRVQILLASPKFKSDNSLVQMLRKAYQDYFEFIDMSGLKGSDGLTPKFMGVLDTVKQQSATEVVIFNEDNLLAIHLAQYFRSKGSTIALAQDALKPYAVMTKLALRYRFFRSAEYYRYCKRHGLSYRFLPISMQYGRFEPVSKLYLSHPVSCPNPRNLPTEELKLDADLLEYLAENLPREGIDFTLPSIFFSSSLMGLNKDQWILERELLEMIASAFPGHQLILKLHPRAHPDLVKNCANMKAWQVMQNTFPAEIYLSKFQSCISISSYSGVALYPGPEGYPHQRIWLYPIYQGVLKPLSYLRLSHPHPGIHIVKSMEELKEYLKTINSTTDARQ